MTLPTDHYVRSLALDKALVFCASDADADEVLATAEKFRAFLVGEINTVPAPDKTVHGLRLPRDNDGFVYFRLMDSSILYRCDMSYGALAGGVDRMNAVYETGWKRKSVDESVGTRDGLRADSGYHQIDAAEARRLILGQK